MIVPGYQTDGYNAHDPKNKGDPAGVVQGAAYPAQGRDPQGYQVGGGGDPELFVRPVFFGVVLDDGPRPAAGQNKAPCVGKAVGNVRIGFQNIQTAEQVIQPDENTQAAVTQAIVLHQIIALIHLDEVPGPGPHVAFKGRSRGQIIIDGKFFGVVDIRLKTGQTQIGVGIGKEHTGYAGVAGYLDFQESGHPLRFQIVFQRVFFCVGVSVDHIIGDAFFQKIGGGV